jgi:threonine synthase
VLATAHPAKFPDVVEAAIGRELALPPGIARVMEAEEHMSDISANLGALAAALDAR